MKKIRFLTFVLAISTLILSACGGAAATPTSGGAGKVEAIPVAFIGIVDSIAGDQWVISGTTVTVDPAVVRDGPFDVGDQVKVEGVVNPDGSVTVSRVEVPTPEDVSTLPQFGDINSNDANDNDANANINDSNINDDNINDGNINDDNSNGVNSNDDNSNAANSNDTNTNDDNGNGVNSNDDNGGGGNSNDSNGNDDNSGGGGGNDSGGGGGNDNSGGGGNDDSGGGGGGGGNSNDD